MTRKLRPILAALCLAAASAIAQEAPRPSPVPQLCEMLASADAAVRLAAVEHLGGVGTDVWGLPSHAAVPALLRVFAADSDARCAEMAAFSLSAIGPFPLGALDFVTAQLDAWRRAGADRQVIERIRTAIRQSEAWPGTAIVPDLELLLQAEGCAAAALGALAMLGSDAAPAAPAISRLLEGKGNPGIRWRAAFALATIGVAGEPLLRKGCVDEHAAVRLWCLRTRLSAGATDAALVPALLPWIDDDRAVVQSWAILTVATFGKPAAPVVPKLVALLAEPMSTETVGAQVAARMALKQLGPVAAAAVPALVERLGTELEEDLRSIVLLEAIGPAAVAAIEPLLAIATKPPPADPNLRGGVEYRAQAAIAALARIDPARAAATLLPLVEQKPDDESPHTWHGVSRIGALGPGAATAVPRLRVMLTSDDRHAKARALLVLERIGAPAAAALQDIVAVLTIDDDHLRYLALRAIVAFGEAAAPAIPALEALFARAGNRRTDVIRDLHRLGPAAEPLLVRATTDSEHWTRAIAAEQILRLPAATPEAVAAAVARLDDADQLVRTEVLNTLLHRLHGAPDQPAKHAALARAQVLRLLTSEDPHLRTTCAEAQWSALARRVERHPVAGHYHYGEFTTLLGTWGIQQRPATEAVVFRDAASLATWALPFADDARIHVRGAAAVVLGQLSSSPASRDALTQLATDADAYVRRAAVTALGWHGPEARACHAVLGKALHDGDWFVRAAAATALRAVHAK